MRNPKYSNCIGCLCTDEELRLVNSNVRNPFSKPKPKPIKLKKKLRMCLKRQSIPRPKPIHCQTFENAQLAIALAGPSSTKSNTVAKTFGKLWHKTLVDG